MNNGNVGLDTNSLSWADMVEEDLEQQQQQQHLGDSNSFTGNSPTTCQPSPINNDTSSPKTWSNVVNNQQQSTVDDGSKKQGGIQVSQWHTYAKVLQAEEVAAEAERRAKADAAGHIPLPSDALVTTTYEHVSLNSSGGNDDTKVQGLSASRWASPSQQRHGSDYNSTRYSDRNQDDSSYGYNKHGNDSASGKRYNKFYSDRDRDYRHNDDNGGNSFRKYDNNGGNRNNHQGDRNREDSANGNNSNGYNNRYGDRNREDSANGYNSNGYNRYGDRNREDSANGKRYNKYYSDCDRDYQRNDGNGGNHHRKYDNIGGNWNNYQNDRTSRLWPRGEGLVDDNKSARSVSPASSFTSTGGTGASKWASFSQQATTTTTTTESLSLSADISSSTNNVVSDTQNSSIIGESSEVATSNKNDVPVSTITTTFSAMVTPINATTSSPTITAAPVADTTESTTEPSWRANEHTAETTTSWGEPTATAPEASTWDTTASTTEPSWGSNGETTEATPSWGSNEIEQISAKPAVRITTWKEVIGIPKDDDNEPGLANHAWKLAAATAPPRERRSSVTHSQGTAHSSNRPSFVNNDQQHNSSEQAQSWSTDNVKEENSTLPAPSWNDTTCDQPCSTDTTTNGNDSTLATSSWGDNTNTASDPNLSTPSWGDNTNTAPDPTVQTSSWGDNTTPTSDSALQTPSWTSGNNDTQSKAPVLDQREEIPSNNDNTNPWKAFASKEVERHPHLPQNLHTRPLLPKEQEQHAQSRGYPVDSTPSSTHLDQAETTDDSWGDRQKKMMNSWSS